MKVEIKKDTNQQDSKKYPYIGISKSNSCLILFSSEGTGFVVDGGNFEIGYYRTNWNEDNFTPFKGTITLSND